LNDLVNTFSLALQLKSTYCSFTEETKHNKIRSVPVNLMITDKKQTERHGPLVHYILQTGFSYNPYVQ